MSNILPAAYCRAIPNALFLEMHTLIALLVLSFCAAFYLKKDTDSFGGGLYFMLAFQILPLITSTENEALGSQYSR